MDLVDRLKKISRKYEQSINKQPLIAPTAHTV